MNRQSSSSTSRSAGGLSRTLTYSVSQADVDRRRMSQLPDVPSADPAYTTEFERYEEAASPPESPSDRSSVLAKGKSLVETAQKINWEEDDKENPRNWPFAKKLFITFLAIVAMTFNLVFAASTLIIDPVIQEYFHVGHEVSFLCTSFNLFGIALGGPFIWAPLSEFFGRKYIIIVPTLVYMLLLIGMAIPTHVIAGYLLLRFFGGLLSVSVPTATAGILADFWGPVARGNIMAYYVATFFFGPALGPFLQAILYNSYLGWKWLAWLSIIMCGFSSAFMFIFYKESYGPILLHRRCLALKKQDPVKYANLVSPRQVDITVKAFLDQTVIRAAKMLFTEPILIFLCIYCAIVYGMIYGLFSMISIIWETNRGMSLVHTALMYHSVVSGSIFGAVIFAFCDPSYPKLVAKWRGTPPPELRLRVSMFIAPLLVPVVLFLGWTGNYSQVPWYVPLIALFLVSATFNMLLTTFFNYIGDVYVMYAATAIGGINFSRVGLAGVYPLFTRQMYTTIGTHWSSVIYGGVLLLLVPIPFVLYRYGPSIRTRSAYAPCLDLAIKDEVLAEDDEKV